MEETAGDIDLTEKDDDGYTALHHAVKIGNAPIVDKLVEFHSRFGVTVDSPDKLGLTPYLHARRLGYRDVAAILKEQGLASLGHGDNLFRSPREWSQIGKFERKKAIELNNLGKINVAKIMGKPSLVPLLENSPRLAIPSIVVPSYQPGNRDQNALARKPPHHLSSSLPSLSQMEPIEGKDKDRPMTATRGSNLLEHQPSGFENGRPGPPTVAFADKQQCDGGQQFSTHNGLGKTAISTNMGNASSTTINSDQGTGGILKVKFGSSSNSQITGTEHALVRQAPRTTFAQPVRPETNFGALTMLNQTTKGRIANHFHQSEFDKSKTSEYKGVMLGNLSNIMDILSQQQTKSFRKSVEVKKPETPPKVKKRSKVSTLAIIFGHDGRRRSGRNKKKSRSPATDKKGNKGKDKRDKSTYADKSKTKTNTKSPKSGAEQKNNLPVPTIRIN